MAATSTVNMLIALRLDSRKPNGSVPILLPKPTWSVRAESNVRRMRMKKPDPPCVVCKGNGRVDCHYCYGRGLSPSPLIREGQTMFIRDASRRSMAKMVRYRTCGGSGLTYCSRCLGTGEYRYIMGFHFMKQNDGTQDTKHPIEGDRGSQTADRLLHRDDSDT